MQTTLLAALVWFASSVACLAALWAMALWDDRGTKNSRALAGEAQTGKHDG